MLMPSTDTHDALKGDTMEAITITGAGQSVTLSAEALQDATRQRRQGRGPVGAALAGETRREHATAPPVEQLALPFPLDQAKLRVFLTQWCAIDDEQHRLRAEAVELKQAFQDSLPIRAVLTAVKIVRARRELETHPTGPMCRAWLAHYETMVEQHLVTMQEGQEATAREAAASRAVPDMALGTGTP